MAVCLGGVCTLGRDVSIMEGVKGRAEFFDELESGAGSLLRVFDRVAAVIPWPQRGAWAKGVGERITKRMPVDNAEPQMVLHRAALDLFVLVVVPERQRIAALGSLETNAFDFRKCGHTKTTF